MPATPIVASDAAESRSVAVPVDRGTPAPDYILRAHETQVNTVAFVPSSGPAGNLLLSGDADGYVAVWSLDTFRPLSFAKAHNAGILTVASWASGSKLLTHGRDNKIHAYDIAEIISLGATGTPSPSEPSEIRPLYTIETNALGYCKCATMDIGLFDALVAVPSTLDENLVDIFHLPSCKRVYRSIGKDTFHSKTGTVMSLVLTSVDDVVQLLAAYEDGRVAIFTHAREHVLGSQVWPEENQGWLKATEAHEHKEPIMGLCFDQVNKTAWSVSADHLVVRYVLQPQNHVQVRPYKTAYPGRGALAVRDDGRILATAGWDGKVRIHSAASFKPLAVLEYHRDSLYIVAFQSVNKPNDKHAPIEGARETNPVRRDRAWLATAGADHRISLWSMYPPSST